MATLIQMPKLGLTMTEGTITDWVAEAGQRVSAGEVVMLIETDKVEAEVEAVADGLVYHTASVGETLEPGSGVGWLLADGEVPPDGGGAPEPAPDPEPSAVPDTTGATAAEPAPPVAEAVGDARVKASPNAKRLATELGVDIASITGTGPAGRITSEDVEAAAPAGRGLGGRILASPNARRVAGLRGVDIATVTGTGPGGRITSEDVEAVADGQAAPATPTTPAASVAASEPPGAGSDRFVPFAAARAAQHLGIDIAAVTGTGPGGRVSRRDVYAHARSVGSVRPQVPSDPSSVSPGDRVPVAGMRRIISQRMHESLQEMAQLTLAMDVDMDNAVQLRDQLKDIGAAELGAVPGYTDMVIAAVARALVEHPMVNSRFEGDEIAVCEEINVGMAVAVPDGLVVPVIAQTDQLGLVDLAVETSRLAAAARDKKLTLAEMEGGTFSVTALGMYGVDMFTPIINSPEAGILGVGRIRDDVDWADDRPVKAKRMTLSLTWDHRVVDGAPAADFAKAIKGLLEQPLRLLG